MIQLNLDKNKKYLLACSYGPDSMALFSLLKNSGYQFDVAIVHYHLRKESDSEVVGLKIYASKNNVQVYVQDVKDVPSKNIEANCRKIRYEFFEELVNKYHYDAVLVAHHQDDLIETYLLQKNRQNNPIFYGINENTVINNVRIIRPLLAYTKDELIDYCKKHNVPFSIDITNFDLTIKRNKIRHQIVSKMSSGDRSKIISEINDQNKCLAKMFAKLNSSDLNDVTTILSFNETELSYALNELLKKTNNQTRLSRENVGQVISILKSKKPNGTHLIKNDLYLVKEYDRFYFAKRKNEAKGYQFILNEPSKYDNDYVWLDFTKDTSNRNVTIDDYPLTIRNASKLDTVLIKGYKVEVRRLFIDWKMPNRLRDIWPVIINKDNKIIYIPRYQKEFKPDSNCNFYVKQ